MLFEVAKAHAAAAKVGLESERPEYLEGRRIGRGDGEATTEELFSERTL